MQISAKADAEIIIRSDPLLVRRILQNLVSNAIRHSEGGEVTIKALRAGEDVHVLGHDTGKGISETDRARMFDEFVKGEGSHTGLGLGLTIVKRLARVLNLKVDVISSDTEGTAFIIKAFKPAKHIELLKDETSLLPESDTGKVLVIDDDRATLEATAALLSNWGWDIDARLHLGVIEIDSMDAPDLIISDFEIGFGQTGLGIVQEMQTRHGYIPTLIITGSSLPETRRLISGAGYLILHKPVMPNQLRSAIISVMG